MEFRVIIVLVEIGEFSCTSGSRLPLFHGEEYGELMRKMSWGQLVDRDAVSEGFESRESDKSFLNIKFVYSWQEGILP